MRALDGLRKEEEAEFFHIADGDMRAWEDMRTRSSQEWGAGDRCTCGRGLMCGAQARSIQMFIALVRHLDLLKVCCSI